MVFWLTTLKEAKEQHPFVAKELVKIKHEFPHDEFDMPLYGTSTGSRKEAFENWHRTKEVGRTSICYPIFIYNGFIFHSNHCKEGRKQ